MPGMTWKARTRSAAPVSYTALLIAQWDVHHTRLADVESAVGGGRVLERELGGGERGQRQLAQQAHRDLSTAGDVPAGGQRGRDGGDLAAPDGEPATVERTTQRELDLLAAVPGAHQCDALMGQQVQRPGQRG